MCVTSSERMSHSINCLAVYMSMTNSTERAMYRRANFYRGCEVEGWHGAPRQQRLQVTSRTIGKETRWPPAPQHTDVARLAACECVERLCGWVEVGLGGYPTSPYASCPAGRTCALLPVHGLALFLIPPLLGA
jgi:hypothetical protein